MELRRLRYFLVVAEELNFCRAAERLRIAQPPLSVQIRNLEDELGAPLFQKVNRRLSLTPAGQHLLEEGRRLLLDVQRVTEQVQRMAQGETGRLSIGFVGTAMYDVLPDALQAFRARFPQVGLNLEDLSTREQLPCLHARKIDLCILRPPVQDDSVESEELLRESLLVALPEKHRLARRREVAIAELASEPFVMCSGAGEPGLRAHYLDLAREAGFCPRIIQEATHIQTQVGLVAAGVGLCLVPSSVTHLLRPGVVYRPVRAAGVRLAKVMVWRREPVHPALGALMAALRRSAATATSALAVAQPIAA